MATETHYSIFKSLYDEELARFQWLIARGQVYLGICTFFLGGSALKLEGTRDGGDLGYGIAVVNFVIAFILIVLALGIYSYEAPFDPVDLLARSKLPDDGAFREDRIVDLAAATNRNAHQNERRANLLQIASYLMVVGLLVGFGQLFRARIF
jgi:hypothetical protein